MKKKDTTTDNFSLFQQELKTGEFRSCYVFHGVEGYLKEFYFRAMREKILPKGSETFNYHPFTGSDMDLDQLEESIDAVPMIVERTVVVVEDWDMSRLNEGNKTRLIQILEHLPSYCTVIFLYTVQDYRVDGRTKLATVLKKVALIVEFLPLSTEKLVEWLKVKRFPAIGKEISTDLARELVFYCGDSMTKLSGEVEKIGAYALDTKITLEDIHAVAVPHVNAVVFSMTDAMASGDFDVAIKILGDLYQMEAKSRLRMHERELGILGAISRQMRQLYQSKLVQEAGRGEAYLCKLLGVSPFVAEKMLSTSRRFSLHWCRRAVLLCAETDQRMKTTGVRGQALLTNLVLLLAQP